MKSLGPIGKELDGLSSTVGESTLRKSNFAVLDKVKQNL